MIKLNGDNVVFEKRIMKSRIISQMYTAGVNYIPKIFLNENKLYGKQTSEFIIQISKDRFFQVHYRIRDGIKNDIKFKEMLTLSTKQIMNEFHDEVSDFEKSIREGTFSALKMERYIEKHIEVLALAEYNGCLPIEWYEKTIENILGKKTAYSLFGHTEFISHRQQFRNAKLLLVKELIQYGYISSEQLHEFWVKWYHLDSKIDHSMVYHENEYDLLLNSLEELKKEYTIARIDEEIAYSNLSYQNSKERYEELLKTTEAIMRDKKYTSDEVDNYISALKIISLATTEEEYRHMQQDKFFRLLTYIFKIYDLCPVYTSIELLISTLRSVPYEYVVDQSILNQFV